MAAKQTRSSRKTRAITPLDQAKLRDLALTYVARFSTTRAKLVTYLHRKIRERGVEEGADKLDVDAVADRIVELGYIDDAAYAQAKSAGLLRKGYGGRRVDQALRAAGVDETIRSDVAPDEIHRRHAAMALASKRGFGPFGRDFDASHGIDLAKRQKQIAAMVRAGHDFAAAKAIVDASSMDEAEQWVSEAEDDWA
ncbi:MAG: regulatory protein RecX [Altererythrobacter sp.]|nr:regulatory protein RecX [Altererythrobacter sp.]